MSFDWDDSETLEELLRAVRSGDEITHKLLRMSNDNQKAMIEAFNKVAGNLEKLTQAVEGLRTDITPPLDKPAVKGLSPKKGDAP
ncbi:MAG: hypothetical protein GC185_03045 [Alphaproteobacteria bacterium]|nr:hypothetical protein [Alphaproteobacteria bacterium]